MSLDWKHCAAVESVPGKLVGVWLFKGTRIPVSVLFDNLQDGLTVQEIIVLHEGLTMEHIYAVLDFVADSAVEKKDVYYAIAAAESLLPGKPAPKGGNDPRWQAMLKIGDFIDSEPEAIWTFVLKWGSLPNEEDLSQAVATLLLEHLLRDHFDLIFPRVVKTARENPSFAETFLICWKLGQAEEAGHSEQFDRLRAEIQNGEK
jgi:uncharacterized protein (DUF433 family)